MRLPRAFSLVELLAALVLLAVGLAATVRAAAGVARLERDAALRHTIASALQARLDTLATGGCGAGSGAGETARDGIRERWTAVAAGARLLVTDTIDAVGRPALSRALSVVIACQP